MLGALQHVVGLTMAKAVLIRAIRQNMLQLAQQISQSKAGSAAARTAAAPMLTTGGDAGVEYATGASQHVSSKSTQRADREVLRKQAPAAAAAAAGETAAVSTNDLPNFWP